MSKRLYNFYIDEQLVIDVTNKLNTVCGKEEKGQMASLIRVMLRDFVDNTPNQALLNKIKDEYAYTTTKNKRSKM